MARSSVLECVKAIRSCCKDHCIISDDVGGFLKMVVNVIVGFSPNVRILWRKEVCVPPAFAEASTCERATASVLDETVTVEVFEAPDAAEVDPMAVGVISEAIASCAETIMLQMQTRELKCLNGVRAASAFGHHRDVDSLLATVTPLIPLACSSPSSASARVEYKGKTWDTNNFGSSGQQSAKALLVLDGEVVGHVQLACPSCSTDSTSDSAAHCKRMLSIIVELIEEGISNVDHPVTLQETNIRLRERIKEQTCIYGVTQVVVDAENVDDIMGNILDYIPNGWQYPASTCARVRFKESIWQTEDFEETMWRQNAPLFIRGQAQGSIEVFYTQEYPAEPGGEGPFLREERVLLDSIAKKVGHGVEFIQSTARLGERVKELSCFYEVTNVLSTARSIDTMLEKIIAFLPPSWQHPLTTCARITYKDTSWTTDHFEETIWRQSAPLIVSGQVEGSIEVFYTQEHPAEVGGEGPFLREERLLLDSVAQKIGRGIEFVLSRELATVTLASIGDGVITTDNLGRIIRMNPVAQDLTGYKEADAYGESLVSVFNIINAFTRKPVENPVTGVMREGKVVGLANHAILVAKDGTERHISDSAAPIYGRSALMTASPFNQGSFSDISGSDGDSLHSGSGTAPLLGVVLVFRDVTESYQRTQAIKSTHSALRDRVKELNCMYGVSRVISQASTIDEMLERIVSLLPPACKYPENAGARVTYCDVSWTSQHFEETEWRLAAEVVVGGHIEGSLELFYSAALPDAPGGEGPFLREEWLLLSNVATKLSRGIDRMLSRNLANVTLASIADAVITVDSDGLVKRVNDAAQRLTGWAEDEAVGQKLQTVYSVVHAVTREPIENPIEIMKRVGRGTGQANNSVLISRDGTEYNISDSAAPIIGKDLWKKSGASLRLGYVLVFSDVTKQYRQHHALERAHNAMRERLKELNCVYSVSSTVVQSRNIDEMLSAIVELLPPSWVHSDSCCARIGFRGVNWTTRDFHQTAWRQYAPIVAEDHVQGSVEIFYKEEHPNIDGGDGPFLREERVLLNNVAQTIGQAVEGMCSREMAEVSLTAIGDAVITTNPHGRVNRMNKAAEKLTGWTEKLAAGMSLGTVFHVVDTITRKPVMGSSESVVQYANIFASSSNQLLLVAKDGTDHHIAGSLSPIYVHTHVNHLSAANSTSSSSTSSSAQRNRILLGVVLVFRDVTLQFKERRALQQAYNGMRERIKELNCIYNVVHIMTQSRMVSEMLEKVVAVLPSAWQFPASTCARITYDDTSWTTDNFRETLWLQNAPLIIGGQVEGSIEVYYNVEHAAVPGGEGPFLREERLLLDSVAKLVGYGIDLVLSRELAIVTVSSVGDAVIIADGQGRITRMNATAEDLTGWAEDDAAGRLASAVLMTCDPRTGKSSGNPVDLVLESGREIGRSAGMFLTKDGQERRLVYNVTPLLGHAEDVEVSPNHSQSLVSPTPLGVVLVFQEASEHKHSSNTYQTFEEAYHALRERVKELNCMYNVSHVMSQSRNVVQMLSKIPSLLPQSWQHPENASSRLTFLDQSWTSDHFSESQWCQNSDIIVNGRPQGRIQVYYDKEFSGTRGHLGPFLREEALLLDNVASKIGRGIEGLLARELAEVTLSSIGDGVITTDPRGNISRINGSALLLTGYQEDEAVGQHISNIMRLFDPVTEEPTKNQLGSSMHSMKLLLSKDRKKHIVHFTVAPVIGSGALMSCYPNRGLANDTLGSVVIFRDVSEQYHKHVALEKAHKILRGQLQQLNCLFDVTRASSQNDGLRDFLEKVANILPSYWQYPDTTCARISFRDVSVTSAQFIDSPWRLCAPLLVGQWTSGSVDVLYTQEHPPAEEGGGPFLREEQLMLESVASKVGLGIEVILSRELPYRRFVSMSGVGVVVTGPDGRIKNMSPMAEQLTGWSKTESTGQLLVNVLRLRHAVTGILSMDLLHDLSNRNAAYHLDADHVLVAKGGEQYCVIGSVAPVFDDMLSVDSESTSGSLGLVVVFQDVTHLLKKEGHTQNHIIDVGDNP